jgi:LmbE family N-acetylglucosaminyl deacetylase
MKDVVYYVPHQDDEAVNFGVSILNHFAEGYRVHLVLCTDGSASGVKRILSGEVYCEWHQCRHDFGLSEQEFVAARNREFVWAAGCLGIPPERVHIEQVAKDRQLTLEQSVTLIRKYAALLPKARHISYTAGDVHPDHAVLGKALKQLNRSEEIDDVRFQIKFVEFEKWNGNFETCKADYLPFLKAADQVYRVYQPDQGLYAIGYHSAACSFDGQLRNPRSKYHT